MSEGFSVSKAKGDWFVSFFLLVMFGAVVALGLLLSVVVNHFWFTSVSHAYIAFAGVVLMLIINFWGDE